MLPGTTPASYSSGMSTAAEGDSPVRRPRAAITARAVPRERPNRIEAAGSDGILQLWDVETGQLAGSFGGTGRLLTWDLSEDGRALLARQMPSSASVVNTFMLDRPAETRRFVNERLPPPGCLRGDPDDPAAMRTIGEWYALRGLDETALSFFERCQLRDQGPRHIAARPLLLEHHYPSGRRPVSSPEPSSERKPRNGTCNFACRPSQLRCADVQICKSVSS